MDEVEGVQLMQRVELCNGSVELLSVWGDDLDVANVARVSFDKRHEELTERDVKLISYLWRNEHTSPFRHQYLKLGYVHLFYLYLNFLFHNSQSF